MINVCCWTAEPVESDAFWKIYGRAACRDGRSSRSVAVRSTYARLRDSISPPATQQIFLGQVTYSLQGEGASVFIPVFRKRPAFRYETEVRLGGIFVHEGTYDAPPVDSPSPWIPCDLESLIVHVVVSPYSAPEYLDEVKELVRAIDPIVAQRTRRSAGGRAL